MVDGKKYFVQKGQRVLPQGAPTSPAITNVFCFRLDKRLEGVARKFNCNYTRYADDITFSGSLQSADANKILWHIKRILSEEGFTIHPDKIRVMQKSQRQEVTGIVVNKVATVSRTKLRQFRALLHQLKKNGAENASWGGGSLSNAVLGYASFIKMVNPKKAEPFLKELEALVKTTTWKQLLERDAPVHTAKVTPPAADTNNNKPEEPKDKGDWYNVV